VILLIGLVFVDRRRIVWKILGNAVGWISILIGLVGVLYHLNSSFFEERTLKSLTYSAPFAAPLAYTGLGFLLLLNRMVDANSMEWPKWVLFMAVGGYAGNFVFSLMDHAGNGFFNPAEWVPVIAGALAIGFLVMPLLVKVSRGFLTLCVVLLLLEAAIGVWGFVLHASATSGALRYAPLITSCMELHHSLPCYFQIWWRWDCWPFGVCGSSCPQRTMTDGEEIYSSNGEVRTVSLVFFLSFAGLVSPALDVLKVRLLKQSIISFVAKYHRDTPRRT